VVETDDRKNEWGSADGRSDGNVIPFPGDWIGPREELVPIGASVPSADSATPPEEPLGGDAFWSENSDEIHSVLLAPESPSRDHRPPVPRPSQEHHISVPRKRGRPRMPTITFRAPGRTTFVATAAGVAAAVGLLLLLLVLVGGTRLRPPSVTAAVGPAAGELQGDIAVLAAPPAARARAASRPRNRSTKPPTRRARGRSAGVARVASGTPANTTLPVSSNAAPLTEPSSAGGPSAAAAAADSQSAPASGPVGSGAPFGPGTLG
jgi:hypothetical protein